MPSPKTAAKHDKRVRANSLIRPDENWELYSRDRAEDDALRASVRKNGILQPVLISKDKRVVSGNRRVGAALDIGQEFVPVIVVDVVWRDLTKDQRIALLREHNRHRDKTMVETLRESIVDTNPHEARRYLVEHRQRQSQISIPEREIGEFRCRAEISSAKDQMVAAVQAVLSNLRQYLPLTLRHVHYNLLDNPPLKNTNDPRSHYRNDERSYDCLTKLVNRMRLFGLIPMAAIHDPTRPVVTFDVYPSPRPFIDRELDQLFKGYYRNLQASQPHHIEMFAEKLTVQSILQSVAADYTVPLTIGRGFCSLPPIKAIADRFKASGKSKLIVVAVADHDPDGEVIVDALGKTLRDDFCVFNTTIVKAAIGPELIKQYTLHPSCDAKVTSSNYKKFADKHGTHAYELEALKPRQLQQAVNDVITSVLDVDLFNAEVDREAEDAAKLDKARQLVHACLREVNLDSLM